MKDFRVTPTGIDLYRHNDEGRVIEQFGVELGADRDTVRKVLLGAWRDHDLVNEALEAAFG